jgi:Ser/Thr protein kinase RdoA (MazF antagonist)
MMRTQKPLDEVPNFAAKQIADIALKWYGIEGKIDSLVSFEDQNARIKTSKGSFVLKIANKRWPEEDLNVQNLLLDHLKTTAPKITWPKVVPTVSGQTMFKVNGFDVRLLTYVEGVVLADSERSSALNYSIGNTIGQFSKAVQSFHHPVAVKPEDYWNLDNVMACKYFLQDVKDGETRSLIDKFFRHYEAHVSPKIKNLPKGIIHGDANEHNLIVSEEDPTKIVGLIDFGDLQKASHINDLAITLAYSLLDEKDINATAREIINGFRESFRIEDMEFDVLFDLVAMRLITSIILTSNRAKKFPENTYITTSQKSAIQLLKKLEKWKFKHLIEQ